MKKKISERAIFARAKRYVEKEDRVLHKHNPHHRDYILNGSLYAYVVDPRQNSIEAYMDWENFLEWIREEGILKPHEEVEMEETK